MYESLTYKLFMFPNMVLDKTEYSNAVYAGYMFQLDPYEFVVHVNDMPKKICISFDSSILSG